MGVIRAAIAGKVLTLLGYDGTDFRNVAVDVAGRIRTNLTVLTPGLGLATEGTLATLATEAKLELCRLYLQSIDTRDFATDTLQASQLTELQLKADLTETQPVSLASQPLPTGAATSGKQDLLLARFQDQAFTYKGGLRKRYWAVVSGAGGYIESVAVPAGEVWMVQSIAVYDYDSATSGVRFIVYSGEAAYTLYQTLEAAGAGVRTYLNQEVLVATGDKVRVQFDGSLATDTCSLQFLGYVMTAAP